MISELLKDYAKQKMTDRPRYPKEKHWPSDVAKCLRALVYQWRGETSAIPDARLFFIFADGDMHHKAIVQQLEESGKVQVIMKEAPLRDKERNISGKLDALLKLNDRHYVLEIKSINRYGFDEIIREGPKEDHVIQLQLYLHFVQSIYKIDTKQGFLLYKCKDTARFYDFLIEYNENVVNDFFARLKSVEEHLARKTLPDRPYDITDWHCRYCDYKKMCWSGAGGKQVADLNLDEMAKILGELLNVKEQRKALEEEEDLLTDTVKQQLEQKNISVGEIGDYTVELKDSSQKRLDTKKLEEHFKEQLEPFYKITTSKRLSIKENL